MALQLVKLFRKGISSGRLYCFRKKCSTLNLYPKIFQWNHQYHSNTTRNHPSAFYKTIGTFRLSSSLPNENLEEKQRQISQISDLILPVEYKAAMKEMETSRHQRNFQRKFEKSMESLNLPDKVLVGVKAWVDQMISSKHGDHTNLESGVFKKKRESMITNTLFDSCMESKDKEFYLSVVYFIEQNIKEPIGIKLLGKCVECMAECGWYELGKRNIRSVFEGGSKLNISAILKILQVYVKQGDLKFAAELMAILKQAMTVKLIDQSIDKSYDDLMRSLIRLILERNNSRLERQELIKELLFLYQRDEGPEGWNKERAEYIVQLLLRGKCPNCATELLRTEIPAHDQARLRLRVFKKIRRLEVKFKGVVSLRPSPIRKLVEVMQTLEHGLVLDGLNVQYYVEKNKGVKNSLLASMRRITHKRKLVILRKYFKYHAKNMFERESDFDIFYVDSSVDDDLYLIGAALFGSPDVMVLTNDYLRDKGDLLNSTDMNAVLKRWKQTRLLQLETIIKKYIQSIPGYKVQSPEAVYNGHSHLLFSQGSSNYCACIRNVMDRRDKYS